MIHPRRLKGSATNIARYYTVGDYYTKGTDEHSEWGGALAAGLGLSGRVDPATFKELLAGKVAGQQLGRHRQEGGIEHHPGWDFSVNAPKSVSIMALVGGDERIIAAHERAVGTALAYLEEHATLRRRDEGTGTAVQQSTRNWRAQRPAARCCATARVRSNSSHLARSSCGAHRRHRRTREPPSRYPAT